MQNLPLPLPLLHSAVLVSAQYLCTECAVFTSFMSFYSQCTKMYNQIVFMGDDEISLEYVKNT